MIFFFNYFERNLKRLIRLDRQQQISLKKQVILFFYFLNLTNFKAKIKYGDFHFYLKMIDTPGFTHNTNIRSYFRNLKKNIVERVIYYPK